MDQLLPPHPLKRKLSFDGILGSTSKASRTADKSQHPESAQQDVARSTPQIRNVTAATSLLYNPLQGSCRPAICSPNPLSLNTNVAFLPSSQEGVSKPSQPVRKLSNLVEQTGRAGTSVKVSTSKFTPDLALTATTPLTYPKIMGGDHGVLRALLPYPPPTTVTQEGTQDANELLTHVTSESQTSQQEIIPVAADDSEPGLACVNVSTAELTKVNDASLVDAVLENIEITATEAGRIQEADSTPLQPPQNQGEVEDVAFSAEDELFLTQIIEALGVQGSAKAANISRRQARRIGQLLQLAKPPAADEALFLTGEDASAQCENGEYFHGPIITENQQPLPLQTVTQFLDEFYDDKAKVWTQDPSFLVSRNATPVREITIAKLKERFWQGVPKGAVPWNCLEMATHVEDGLRPAFLNNEDCRLLTKLKIPSSGDFASRRGYQPGWKEVEKWSLLAQGGALTEPHQDSHGYNTYITINQGTVGFGWLSNPTAEERLAWRKDPDVYAGGTWRCVVLRPGQTVFFPSGTVHFVFRLAALGDTLAFGGHVLRCSQIVRWAATMIEEAKHPLITNEEMTVSAAAYLDRVEKFVKQAKKQDQAERWGGKEAIEKFLALKKEFTKCMASVR